MVKRGDLRRCVVLQSDSGDFGDKLATSFDDLSEVWNNLGKVETFCDVSKCDFDVLEAIC